MKLTLVCEHSMISMHKPDNENPFTPQCARSQVLLPGSNYLVVLDAIEGVLDAEAEEQMRALADRFNAIEGHRARVTKDTDRLDRLDVLTQHRDYP